MSTLLLALALLPAAAPAAEEHVREVPVAVYTKDEVPVDDLRVEEIEIKEDGKKRVVVGVEKDPRPVAVALILDSSEHMGDEYAASLVPAAIEFRKRLPPNARLTIWTCGGKVSHAVDFDTNPESAQSVDFDTRPESAESTLRMVAVGGPIFALDTIMDASRDLQKQRRARRVVVIVTNKRIQVTRTLIDRTSRTLARARVTPMVVLIEGTAKQARGFTVGGEIMSWDVETIFKELAEGYGGSYDLVLTPLAAQKMLGRVAADISSQYLVRYESVIEKPARPEVKIKRKDIRVRAGLSQTAK